MYEQSSPKSGILERTLMRFFTRFAEILAIVSCVIIALYSMAHLNILPQSFNWKEGEVVFREEILEASNETDASLERLKTDMANLAEEFDKRLTAFEAQNSELDVTDGQAILDPSEVQDTSATVERVVLNATSDRAEGAARKLAPEAKFSVEGWSWLGTYDQATRRWVEYSVIPVGMNGLPASPSQIQPGAELLAVTDLHVRNGQPQDDDTYFQGLTRLGFIEKGDQLVVEATPVSYLRSGAYQVWAKVSADVRQVE